MEWIDIDNINRLPELNKLIVVTGRKIKEPFTCRLVEVHGFVPVTSHLEALGDDGKTGSPIVQDFEQTDIQHYIPLY